MIVVLKGRRSGEGRSVVPAGVQPDVHHDEVARQGAARMEALEALSEK